MAMAAVVQGAIHSNQACFINFAGSGTWQDNAPDQCKTWSGCAPGDQDGRCAGFIKINIDKVTTAFAVMACEPVETGTVYNCKSFPNTKCNDKAGKAVCLRYRVYYHDDCSGDIWEEWTQSTDECKTDFTGG